MVDANSVEDMIKNEKVLVFSKSYCPFAKKTKDLFASKGIDAKIYELDQMPNGQQIQDKLKELTGQGTVPNVFIGGKHLGGNDDTQKANGNGQLDEKLKACGAM